MTTARFILGCCERFSKLPSEVLAEDAELLRLLRIEDLAGDNEVPAELIEEGR